MLKNALKMLFCVRSPFPLEGPPAHICAARFSVKCGSRQSAGANVYCSGTPGIPLSFCIIALHLPPLISAEGAPHFGSLWEASWLCEGVLCTV